jgi:predicted protein tyrosine phosphatase
MLRRVLFLSQARAEAMRPPRGAALISITNADASPANLPDSWAALHRAAFDDIDPDDTEFDDFFADDDYEYVPMSMDQATAIAEFIVAIERHCTSLVVHCRFGQSRSAAIAKAVCTARGLHFPRHYELPNPFVYRLMCRALGTTAPD